MIQGWDGIQQRSRGHGDAHGFDSATSSALRKPPVRSEIACMHATLESHWISVLGSEDNQIYGRSLVCTRSGMRDYQYELKSRIISLGKGSKQQLLR